LRELLETGTLDANWTDPDGGPSLLMHAAGADLLENVKVLLEAGADIDARASDEAGVLVHAFGVESGIYASQVVDLLIERKATLDRDDPYRWMASSGSANAQALEMFARILEISGASRSDVRSWHREPKSFMELAVRHGRTAICNDLLSKGVPVPQRTPFEFLQGSLRDIALFDKVFLASGAPIDIKDVQGRGLATICLEHGRAGSTDLFTHLVIKHNAPMTLFDSVRPPGTLWQSQKCVIPLDILDVLLKRGEDPFGMPPTGKDDSARGWLLSHVISAVEYASRQRPRMKADTEQHVQALCGRLVASWGQSAEAFAKTASGAKSLAQATHLECWDLSRQLIKAGAGLEGECRDFGCRGMTPLMSCTRHGSHDMIMLLLQARADVVAAERKDVLKIASEHLRDEQLRTVRALLEAAMREARELMAKSGDGTIDNVGIKLHGKVQCGECNQKFDNEKALKIHWRFIHDPKRHQED
jgi:ankyrin repeat protein